MDIKITIKLSPQRLYCFEAECDGGRWHHVSNQLRRTAEQAQADAQRWRGEREKESST